LILGIFILKFGISKWNRKCGALPFVDNIVAWVEQMNMLKT